MRQTWKFHNQGCEWRSNEHHWCWTMNDSAAREWKLSSRGFLFLKLNWIKLDPAAVKFLAFDLNFYQKPKLYSKKRLIQKGRNWEWVINHTNLSIFFSIYTHCAFSVTWLLSLLLYSSLPFSQREMCNVESAAWWIWSTACMKILLNTFKVHWD